MAASFNFVVTSTAAIILILTLAYLAVHMASAVEKEPFPPTHNPCPDLWILNPDGKCEAPSRGNIGSPPITETTKYVTSDSNKTLSIQPLDKAWSSDSKMGSSICAKRQWSNENNISWDGISNYNSC